jgi:pyruvate,orthophosphate dikinase
MVNDDAGWDRRPVQGSDAGIFTFDHDHAAPARELVHLLGGKGAGLAEMSAALGLAVPPGFTVSVPVCRVYRETGWPAGLDEALAEHTERLGQAVGRRFGDAADPLLVAVRSGAPVSMPGMLDTVLNLGLNDETMLGLAARSGDERFAWDSYRRFVLMYATTVMGVPAAQLSPDAPADSPSGARDQVGQLRERAERISGKPLPADPYVQLREAVEAVFRSWECGRARAYRAKEGIDEAMGTAVNVQAMVFGNRGSRSGTGVVFTRNPSTGEPVPYGDYLPQAQGEDVVAGTARTMPISHLGQHEPAAYQELLRVMRRLEVHYRDVCDVEFTIEDGRLWLLQTRIGKRSAAAAVRIAVDLVHDPEIRLDPAEALIRVPAPLRERARREVQDQAGPSGAGGDLFGTGLGASPGRVSGQVVLSSEEAADADGDVILVRAETSPEDVAGMAASAGVLTTTGGLVSHAAVVARSWGIPAVVGAHELTLRDGEVRSASGTAVRAGDVITIDGSTGEVWRGTVEADEPTQTAETEMPYLGELEAWAQRQASDGLRA